MTDVYKNCALCGSSFTGHPRIIERKKCCSKKCQRNYWRLTHREKYLISSKEYNNRVMNTPELYVRRIASFTKSRKTPRGRFHQIKNGAIHRKYLFSLTYEQFLTFWNKPCYYCGNNIDGVGIDRMNNSIGYEMLNCVPCCIECNIMKNTKDLNQFLTKCKKIVSHLTTNQQGEAA